jgi:hypothetical protein
LNRVWFRFVATGSATASLHTSGRDRPPSSFVSLLTRSTSTLTTTPPILLPVAGAFPIYEQKREVVVIHDSRPIFVSRKIQASHPPSWTNNGPQSSEGQPAWQAFLLCCLASLILSEKIWGGTGPMAASSDAGGGSRQNLIRLLSLELPILEPGLEGNRRPRRPYEEIPTG